jgi:hypothetical protein
MTPNSEQLLADGILERFIDVPCYITFSAFYLCGMHQGFSH